jgi:hypothetical protein
MTTKTNLKDKVAMVVTHPLFASQAERLARDFKKVYLVTPFNSHSFPTILTGRVGEGLKNVTKIDSIWGKELDETDIVIFSDIYFPDEQIRLERMGFAVWGGRNGEEIELWRDLCKEVMEKQGLPTQPWKPIVGMTALREYLKAHEKTHVKISKWRGTFETFFCENYDLAVPKLDEIEVKLGCFKEVAEMIVEDTLPDCVEVGTDLFCIDGDLPSQTIVGVEIKDTGYACEFMKWAEIPEPVRRWNESMAPVFERYGYRGWLSNEIRIGKDKVPYMIDATCRSPSPPSELIQEYYTNYSEIIWNGAHGILIDPIPAAKFGVQVIMKSSFAVEHCQPVDFDPQFANQIKLYNPAVINGRHFTVPQDDAMEEVGSVIGWGDTLDEAVAHMQKAADTVKGYGIKIPLASVDEAKEQMAEINAMGIKLFSVKD